MVRLRYLLLLLALCVPLSASAATVKLTSLTGSVSGFSFSSLFTPNGCQSGGFYLCGSQSQAVTGATLIANQSGSAFNNINGSVLIGGMRHKLTGNLDFEASQGAPIGQLTIRGIGTFDFVNTAFTGPANGYTDNKVWLSGQTFSPQVQPGNEDLGLGIAFEVTPAIPEPSAALAFGVGALLVRAGARRRPTRA